MQFVDLKHTLEEQYSVACITWLEDLECQASSTLYRSWVTHLRPAYEPNHRFILLNFRPVGRKILKHVTQLIKQLDISPCFVLVITDQIDTAEWFQTQADPVQVKLVNYIVPHLLPTNKIIPQFNNRNIMCAHAWTGVHVWPNGETSPCCEYSGTINNSNSQPYNIQMHSIDEIMHSGYMNQIRNEFRQGQFPIGCQRCNDTEQSMGESKHQLTLYKLENIYNAINWESDQIDSSLGFIGGHLGNLCNLRCRICSPVFSSSIATEELDLVDQDVKSHPTYQLLADNRWSRNSEPFWQMLRSQADQVCNFEFLGGEPLLLKENLEFMQWLIDHGHSQRAIFEFVTNGTQYPKIFDQAHLFRRLTVTVSIDNIGSKFELERNGASWPAVVDNVKKFVACKQQNPSLHVGVCITVNIQNVLYLPELVTWIRAQGIDHYYFNVLVSPHYLSVDQLTKSAKELVLNKLRSANLEGEDQNKLQYIINCVAGATTSDGQLFCQMMQDKDQLRRESFILTHQEIAEAMGCML
jgi:MoaA/NifB/PqqE/SkfB family radical SAM enzyme